MTNEEAITILTLYRAKIVNSVSIGIEEDVKAYDMAISALSQMESAGTQITNSNLKSESEIKVDLISRESVLGILYDNLGKGWRDVDGDFVEGKICKDAIDDIKKLPTYPANLVKESGVLVKDLVKEDLISRKEVLKEGAYYSNRPTHTFLKVVKELPAYSAEQTYDWCNGCKEYDNEKHCCHRYSSFIRETLQDSINALLEDIKTEIDDKCYITVNDSGAMTLYDIFKIIDNHISGKENE